MSMNPYLAAMYDTHGYGQAVQEEQTKVAHLELFAKTAAAEGIDLSLLSPEQQTTLFNQFISKLAEDDGKKAPPFEKKEEKAEEHEKKETPAEEKKEEEAKKEAAAREELARVHEWQQKVAEADFLGRTMAHSFWAETQEIQKEAGTTESIGKSLGRLGSAAADEASKHKGKLLAGAGAAGAGAMAAGGTAGYLHGKHLKEKKEEKKKESSAFDAIAAEHAVKIAEAAGWNTEEATTRINAVIALGGPSMEGTKVAQVANDYEAAMNVRGLEFLEAAGYPVDWAQVFGS